MNLLYILTVSQSYSWSSADNVFGEKEFSNETAVFSSKALSPTLSLFVELDISSNFDLLFVLESIASLNSTHLSNKVSKSIGNIVSPSSWICGTPPIFLDMHILSSRSSLSFQIGEMNESAGKFCMEFLENTHANQAGLIEEKFPKDISSGLCRMIIENKPFGALTVLTISMDTFLKPQRMRLLEIRAYSFLSKSI